MDYILTIDQGTTSTRAVIFDHERNVISIAQKEFTQYFPKPGWVEHDAEEIWLTTLAVLAEVLNYGQISPKNIMAIGITNQRETTVLWDKNTGIPVYHAIVWQSRQSDYICDELKDKGYKALVKDKTGLPIDAYFSASKIRWIFDNVEGSYQKAVAGDLLFGTIDTWLLWKLTGQKVHATDVSNASRTLLFNINTMMWDDTLLDIFDIPKIMLPSVHPTSHCYGKTAKHTFFNEEIIIASLVGDQQAALFGQCCFSKGMVKNTYGTGGFLLMNTGDEIIHSKHGLISTVAWQLNDKVQYALEGSIFVSGSLIQWLRDGLHLIDKASDTEEMAFSVPDNNGVYIVPAFVGLGAPYWNDECTGAVFGLTRGVNQNHIARASLESICYQSKDLLDAMEKDANMKINSLKVDGGATSNKFILQFQSDLLNIPVELLKSNEATALGAAYFAGLAIDFWQLDDLKPEVHESYLPNGDAALMMKQYSKWQKAIKACIEF